MPEDRPLPAPVPPQRALDRAALERVLARAAELQAGAADPPEELSEERLFDLGQEVGLSPDHLRQALAEERTRVHVPQEQGLVARLAGPTTAVASRVVPGTPDAVLAALDGWMQREECLQVKRRYTERVTWEARRDLLGNIKRGLRLGGRGYELARAAEVGATVSAVDAGRVLVRLDADLAHARTVRLRTSGGLAAAGVAVGGAWLTVAATFLVPGAAAFLLAALGAGVPVAAGIGGAYGLARSHHTAVTRAQLALEQLLDRLEHGELRRAPSLLDLLAAGKPIR